MNLIFFDQMAVDYGFLNRSFTCGDRRGMSK